MGIPHGKRTTHSCVSVNTKPVIHDRHALICVSLWPCCTPLLTFPCLRSEGVETFSVGGSARSRIRVSPRGASARRRHLQPGRAQKGNVMIQGGTPTRAPQHCRPGQSDFASSSIYKSDKSM